ncbi:MAG: Hpt domain-containing protein [Gammaproteobacteria bacterium]|nr:Hpt domain-containing protein [Gammaproteobacteria bacterium]
MKSLDNNIALKASAGNEQLANQLLQLFIEQSATYQNNIETSLKSEDLINLQKGFHKLHGAMKYIGAPVLLNLVEQVDGKIEQFEFSELERRCRQIFDEIEQIRALKHYF